jgi:hypothetical protein
MHKKLLNEYMPNRHMNLFAHYAESPTDVILENNLTRSLAIVLQNDEMVRDNFLAAIVPSYRELDIDDDAQYQIDIQRDTSCIEPLSNIYAVSLTTRSFSHNDFDAAKENSTELQRPDLTIAFGDTLIVIEVKRNDENCLNQLKTQISRIQGESRGVITYTAISWSLVIDIIEKVCKKRDAGRFQQNRITSDFVEFLKMQYPGWVLAKPLSKIKTISDSTKPQIIKRLDKIKNSLGRELNSTGGRNSISIDWGIASEINVQPFKNEESKIDFITVAVWPGDTKSQGWGIWCNERWKKWINEKAMRIFDYTFEIETSPYIKFSHFQQGVDWLWIKQENINQLGDVFFRQISGRKWRQDWGTLDQKLSALIPDWKAQCKWQEKFEGSNRNKVEISIGCEYVVYIPYAIASIIDATDDTKEFSKLLNSVIEEMKTRLIG